MSKIRTSQLKSQMSARAGLAQTPRPAPNLSSQQMAREVLKGERQALAAEIPTHIIKRAWFCTSHLLLDKGATIIDAGSMDGQMAYAMASLHPDKKFIGIDVNPDLIQSSAQTYRRENLEFQNIDLIQACAQPQSVDAIINSFFLHEVYSASQYNTRIISKVLEEQYKALKDNGYILIRDFITPSSNEYVQIELKDIRDKGDNILTMSEADLLIWYSENARSSSHYESAGFFLEEIPSLYPNTRLFRLPIKWAYEFINRKDDRETLKRECHKEYAFFTEQEFRRELRTLGMRIAYTSPHWDDGFIKTRYDGKVRLYREDGSHLGPPPTSHIILAQRVSVKRSHIVLERRASRNRKGIIHMRSVRDERTGQISDIATRDLELAEIIPYRIDETGKIKIYLHENIARGLVNSVPRNGRNLDGKTWSGHFIEAISTKSDLVNEWVNLTTRCLQDKTAQFLGVPASLDAEFEKGPGFYPDPYRIDERITTYFYRVELPRAPFTAIHPLVDTDGFSFKGQIREFDAQDILNAIAVGLIPAPRLEPQILAISHKHKIPVEVWDEMPIHLSEVKAEDVKDLGVTVKKMLIKDTRFKDIKGSAGNIRVAQSVFVDEGRDETGGAASLASRDIEFIHAEDTTINTAVVLPLVKDLSGEVLAGVCTEYLPVPQRHRGSGLTMTLPSFALPKDITDMDSARRYIAEKFRIDAKFIARMGESYYTHIGLTPHRIFPFVVSHSRFAWVKGVPHGATQLSPLRNLYKMLYWDNHDSFMKITAMAYKNLCQDSSLSVRWNFDNNLSNNNMGSRMVESNYVMGSAADMTQNIPTTMPKAGESLNSHAFSEVNETDQSIPKQINPDSKNHNHNTLKPKST